MSKFLLIYKKCHFSCLTDGTKKNQTIPPRPLPRCRKSHARSTRPLSARRDLYTSTSAPALSNGWGTIWKPAQKEVARHISNPRFQVTHNADLIPSHHGPNFEVCEMLQNLDVTDTAFFPLLRLPMIRVKFGAVRKQDLGKERLRSSRKAHR